MKLLNDVGKMLGELFEHTPPQVRPLEAGERLETSRDQRDGWMDLTWNLESVRCFEVCRFDTWRAVNTSLCLDK